jgi:hypothetical protein
MATENRPDGVGICQDCKQTRVLWPFSPPGHRHMDEGALLRCRCGTIQRPRDRVCIGCFGRRAEAEEGRPADPVDVAVLRLVAAQSGPEPATAPGLEERRAS